MTNPRIILNELKWNKKYNLGYTDIYYIHRGAPDNIKKISGAEIMDIDKSFMITKTSMIPYHRIIKISYNQKTIFNRS